MQPTEFTLPSGILLSEAGTTSFVPAPLPPAIDLAAIALTMSEAMQAIGELRGACRRLQNPYILIRPLQRQEALTSSAMEGTYTTDDHLLKAEAGLSGEPDDSTREIVNYMQALQDAVQQLETVPISHRVVRAAHETLLTGLSATRGARKRPGDYKREQNWIGGKTPQTARYVPPPPRQTQDCMDALERYINREDARFPTPLIDLALVHYQIEAIHPFADGNGRVGRMLVSLMAVQSGLLDMPVLYISPVMEKRKDNYIDLMFGVSARSEWTPWLEFFFNCVTDSCRQTVLTIDRLLSLQEQFRAAARDATRSIGALTLVDHLFSVTVISVKDAADVLGVTYAAARGTVHLLQTLSILAPVANTYPQMYYAPRIRQAAIPDV